MIFCYKNPTATFLFIVLKYAVHNLSSVFVVTGDNSPARGQIQSLITMRDGRTCLWGKKCFGFLKTFLLVFSFTMCIKNKIKQNQH